MVYYCQNAEDSVTYMPLKLLFWTIKDVDRNILHVRSLLIVPVMKQISSKFSLI